MQGKEAIWDTLRLAFRHLKEAFPDIETFYAQNGIRSGSDMYYGGIALNPDGTLGDFPRDNWRRRIHPIMERPDGQLEVIAAPVFNPIPPEAKTSDYIGFGMLPSLPGNYLGHAYGPNFKLVGSGDSQSGRTELWMIHEEVCRRVRIHDKPVEITEIFARRMITPFLAESNSVRLVSVEAPNGSLAPDACRGPLLNYTKLLEGFRPTRVDADGIRIVHRAERSGSGAITYVHDPELARKEYFFLTGSSGNFSGDDYDVIMAVRESSAIGPYRLITETGSPRWKRYLRSIKRAHGLSWAGRGSFISDEHGRWFLLFHAVDKTLKPGGSYTGVIPPNTEEYHRNIYLVPIEFVINPEGEPDLRVMGADAAEG
ncbi:hypothetical protein [Oligoflexus tunisiensis]|uniref:hypothetical protein n=1 Tax=Oligoflexus tunisiensis TaxID=708132 RepID=UPI00114D08BA|nr:hypothetical protein [Oligoflexus tunisiensis]